MLAEQCGFVFQSLRRQNFLSGLLFLLAMSASTHAQHLAMWGCLDGDACDLDPTSDIVTVSNLLIAPDLTLSGTAEYFGSSLPLSPGSIVGLPAIPSTLSVGGIRVTNATLTYSASATQAQTFGIDLASSNMPLNSPTTGPPVAMVLMNFLDGDLTFTSSGVRSVDTWTLVNGYAGALGPAQWTASVSSSPAPVFATGWAVGTYTPPQFSSPNMAIVTQVSLRPGDVLHLPTSIESGVAMYVPEPSSLLLLVSVVTVGLLGRRKRSS